MAALCTCYREYACQCVTHSFIRSFVLFHAFARLQREISGNIRIGYALYSHRIRILEMSNVRECHCECLHWCFMDKLRIYGTVGIRDEICECNVYINPPSVRPKFSKKK